MFTKFKNNYKTILLDPFMEPVQTEEKINVVLSPSLYWVKKISLPVKYIREVKKLLPSIFEDILPEGHYSYYAYKENDEYIVFAYEDKMILELMAQKEISPSNVVNIYFAQSEFSSLEGACRVNEKQALVVKNGIVILVPDFWIKEAGILKPDDFKPSGHAIVLQQFNHILKKSSFYKIGFVLLFITGIVFGEWLITMDKAATLEDQRSAVFAKYNLKPTMMQNQAIHAELNKIYEKQMKLREYIGYFLKMHLAKNEKISYIGFDSKVLTVIIKGVTQSKKIIEALKRKGIHAKTQLKNSVLTLEITL
ncbi:hypothetical protein [Sulfurimonas sp. NWX367]|uniref:hypothetical protein n=1 Tax=Sulfurimonas sp. NWX367 TaxID=2925413 RepID=UPI003204A82C